MSPTPPSDNEDDLPRQAALARQAGELPVDIFEVDAEAAHEWNQATARLPGATWYHQYEWRSVNEESLGHRCTYLAARAGGRIVGILPLTFVSSRLFGRFLCSMPFVNSGGPCAEDPEIVRRLIARAVHLAKLQAADQLELRCTQPIDCELQESLRKVSMYVNLDPDPEKTWAAYSAGHRNNIRRAQKNDLEVESGGAELLPEFYRVMEQSWRDLGTPLYSLGYFERVVQLFPSQVRIYVCRRNGNTVGTALNGYFANTAEGLWNGSNAEGRATHCNYVLYWEMIRDASLRGFTWFHLGRSTAGSNSIDFKRKWHAVQRQLHWYYWTPGRAPLPELNVDNPKYRLAIAAWRRLPIPLTRMLGPPLARRIP